MSAFNAVGNIKKVEFVGFINTTSNENCDDCLILDYVLTFYETVIKEADGEFDVILEKGMLSAAEILRALLGKKIFVSQTIKPQPHPHVSRIIQAKVQNPNEGFALICNRTSMFRYTDF